MNNVEKPKDSKKESKPDHYYGDVVRKLFLLIASIMVGAYPMFYSYIQLPHLLSILTVVAVVVLAGFQNPEHYGVALINTVISALGFAIFEFRAVDIYLNPSKYSVQFFEVNELLAILFMLALYFCSKTLRGMYFAKKLLKK